MKKFLFPLLCGIFSLFFSGKPASLNHCGPRFIFQKVGAMTVTQVKVHNLTTGGLSTFDNPTFPFEEVETGGDIEITYYFSAPATGCLLSSGPECEVTSFTNATSVSCLVWSFDCDIHTMRVYSRPPGATCIPCAE